MLPLDIRPAIWTGLTDDQRSRLARLDAWPLEDLHDDLAQLGADTVTDPDAAIREYRRYLALSIIDPTRKHGLAGPVDLVWHEHLVDTHAYHQLCADVIGRFVHHVPQRRSSSNTGPSDFGATVALIARLFSQFDHAIWDGQMTQCSKCYDDVVPGPFVSAQLAA